MQHRAKIKRLLEANFMRAANSITDALAEELSRMGDQMGTQVTEVVAKQMRALADGTTVLPNAINVIQNAGSAARTNFLTTNGLALIGELLAAEAAGKVGQLMSAQRMNRVLS